MGLGVKGLQGRLAKKGSENLVRIVRSIEQSGNLAPVAVNYLGEIPATFTYLNRFARRPPLGIYNVALMQLAADFKQVLDSYDATKRSVADRDDNAIKDNFGRLLENQKSLILSLRAYIDDCYSVLASLIDVAGLPEEVEEINLSEKWLKAAAFPSLKLFNESIAQYKYGYLSPIVNGLKHKQWRLRGIYFSKYLDVRIGYYVEEADSNGILAPSLDVHQDGNSAFSFSRDILFNIYNVYHTSEILVEAIKSALLSQHSFALKPQKKNEYSEWAVLLKRAAALPYAIFPDEVDKPFPYLAFERDSAKESVFMMYPVTTVPLSFPAGMKITGLLSGDGVTSNFKLPYVRGSKYGTVR